MLSSVLPTLSAPSRIGPKNVSAASGRNDVPSQPSANAPVINKFLGPSDATYIGRFGHTGAPDLKAFPRPVPPLSVERGSSQKSPSYARVSPLKIRRQISIISLVCVTGFLKGIPCHPSITCGPLVPRPRIKRPSDMESNVIAVIATSDGVRVPT